MDKRLYAKVRLVPVAGTSATMADVQGELDSTFREQGLTATALFAADGLTGLLEVQDGLGFPPPGLTRYTQSVEGCCELLDWSSGPHPRATPLGFRVEILERATPLMGGSMESAKRALAMDEQRARILTLQEEKMRLEIEALRRGGQ